jgi:hypothetical protein
VMKRSDEELMKLYTERATKVCINCGLAFVDQLVDFSLPHIPSTHPSVGAPLLVGYAVAYYCAPAGG